MAFGWPSLCEWISSLGNNRWSWDVLLFNEKENGGENTARVQCQPEVPNNLHPRNLEKLVPKTAFLLASILCKPTDFARPAGGRMVMFLCGGGKHDPDNPY